MDSISKVVCRYEDYTDAVQVSATINADWKDVPQPINIAPFYGLGAGYSKTNHLSHADPDSNTS